MKKYSLLLLCAIISSGSISRACEEHSTGEVCSKEILYILCDKCRSMEKEKTFSSYFNGNSMACNPFDTLISRALYDTESGYTHNLHNIISFSYLLDNRVLVLNKIEIPRSHLFVHVLENGTYNCYFSLYKRSLYRSEMEGFNKHQYPIVESISIPPHVLKNFPKDSLLFIPLSSLTGSRVNPNPDLVGFLPNNNVVLNSSKLDRYMEYFDVGVLFNRLDDVADYLNRSYIKFYKEMPRHKGLFLFLSNFKHTELMHCYRNVLAMKIKKVKQKKKVDENRSTISDTTALESLDALDTLDTVSPLSSASSSTEESSLLMDPISLDSMGEDCLLDDVEMLDADDVCKMFDEQTEYGGK